MVLNNNEGIIDVSGEFSIFSGQGDISERMFGVGFIQEWKRDRGHLFGRAE
jgi:hypothetical protein